MATTEDWGKDPTVQAMRRVFHAMEEAQKVFLERLDVSPLDPRLRSWRERARVAFESAWSKAARLGNFFGQREAAALYLHCLGKILEADGIDIPRELRAPDQELDTLFKEKRR